MPGVPATLRNDGRDGLLGRQHAHDLAKKRIPRILGLAREALLKRLLERPDQRPRHRAIVAASDAKLAMASAEQLEHGAQPVLLLERDHPELHRRGEPAGLNLDWAIEPRA